MEVYHQIYDVLLPSKKKRVTNSHPITSLFGKSSFHIITIIIHNIIINY